MAKHKTQEEKNAEKNAETVVVNRKDIWTVMFTMEHLPEYEAAMKRLTKIVSFEEYL